MKPGAGVGPPALGGCFGNAQHRCGFLDRHPYEIAELDQFHFRLIERGQLVERLADCEQLLAIRRGGDFNLFNVQALLTASSQASCTRAVGCNVCPGTSRAILLAASLRNSS